MWERAAATEVGRRKQVEESREWLRVILIAWREVADTVTAGAATWDQRWRAAGATYFPLARRLTFSTESGHS